MRRRLAIVVLVIWLAALTLASCQDTGTRPPPARALDSPSLLGSVNGSENYIHVFTDHGIYAYHCAYHTTEHHREPGVVLVQDGAADSAYVQIFQGAFHPETVTVRLNGQVRWRNFDDGVHHDIVSD